MAPVGQGTELVAVADEGQQLVVGDYGFGHHRAADDAGVAAVFAAISHDMHLVEFGHAHDALQVLFAITVEHVVDGQLALRAQYLQQALTDQAGDDGGIGEQFHRHAQVDQSIEDGQGVVGMHRGPHLVTGHGRLHRQARRGSVAHLTDHDDVGVQTHGRLDRRLEGLGALLFGLGIGHRRLHRAHDGILGRVFDGDDMLAPGFLADDGGQHALQRGGFATAGGATDDDDAGGALLHQFEIVRLLAAETQ